MFESDYFQRILYFFLLSLKCKESMQHEYDALIANKTRALELTSTVIKHETI